jgi:hypothetical protein
MKLAARRCNIESMAARRGRRFAALIPLIILAAALIAPLLAPASAVAQDESPFTLDVQAGYEGTYRIGDWFPVIVSLGNSGPDVHAVVEWNFPGQLEEQIFRQEVELPQGSQKRVVMNVFAAGFARNGQVRLLDGDTVLATQDVSLNSVDEAVFLSVVVSSDPAMLNSLDSLQIPGYSNARVRHVAIADLPDHIAALRGINAIFLHDADSTTLSPAQRDALSVWVGQGGQLVVSGGVGGQRAAAGLADVLPAQVGGEIAGGDLAPLAGFVGSSTSPLAADASLDQVQPRAGAEQLPPGSGLLYRWRYGSGLTTFSRFDFSSLRGWPGEPALWGRVLGLPATLAPAAGARLSRVNILDRGVLQLPSLSLPSTGTLLLFLLAYIVVIGPLNYLVLRRLRRLELAWLTVPVIVLLFAGGLYIVGSTLRGGQVQFNQAAVVQGVEGQPRAAATAFIGLFSPRRASYTVGFAPDTLVSNAAGRGSLSDRYDTIVGDETGARSVDVLADVGSVNTFVTHTVVDMPLAVQTTIVSDTAGLRGEVRNTGQLALEDVLLVRGGTFARLGTLAPGATQQVDGGLQANFPRAANVSDTGVFDRQEMLNVLFDRDFIRLSNPGLPGNAANDDGVYLLAWVNQPTVAASVDGQPASQNGLTLYVVRLQTQQSLGR